MNPYKVAALRNTALRLAIEAEGDEDFEVDDFGDVAGQTEDTGQGTAPAETSSSEEGETSSTPETGSESESEEEEDPADAKIELSDTKGLAVDKLAKLNANAAERQARKDLKDGLIEFHDARQDLILLNSAMEGIRRIQKSDQFDNGTEVAHIHALSTKYGLQGTKTAMEGLRVNTGAEIALEGFKDVFKAIVDRILKAIKQVGELISQIFKHFFNSSRIARKANERVFEAWTKLQTTRGNDLNAKLQSGRFNTSEYVSGNLNVKKWLSYDGHFFDRCLIEQRRPDGRAGGMVEFGPQAMVARTTEFVASVKFFGEPSSLEFFKEIETIAATVDQWSVTAETAKGVDPSKMLGDNFYRVKSIDSYICPDDMQLFAREGYLGNVYSFVELPIKKKQGDIVSQLEYLGDWTIGIRSDESKLTDDKMPRLSNTQISAINMEVMKLSDELLSMQTLCEEFEWQSKKIREAVGVLQRAVNQIESATDYADVMRHRNLTTILKVCDCWIKNGSNTLDSTLRYGQAVQFAWAQYLTMVLNQDRMVLSKP